MLIYKENQNNERNSTLAQKPNLYNKVNIVEQYIKLNELKLYVLLLYY